MVQMTSSFSHFWHWARQNMKQSGRGKPAHFLRNALAFWAPSQRANCDFVGDISVIESREEVAFSTDQRRFFWGKSMPQWELWYVPGSLYTFKNYQVFGKSSRNDASSACAFYLNYTIWNQVPADYFHDPSIQLVILLTTLVSFHNNPWMLSSFWAANIQVSE